MSGLPILTHDYILVNPPQKGVSSDESVSNFILGNIKKYGNSRALVHSISGIGSSYKEILICSMAIAKGLRAMGVKPNDTVGICCENRLEYASAVLGILAAGVTCAPINPLYTTNELVHILSIAKPCLIFCSSLTLDKIHDMRLKVPSIKKLILFDNIKTPKAYSTFRKLIIKHSNSKEFEIEKVNPQQNPAFLFCSSGTTGMPKCVELTHSNIMCLLNFIRFSYISSREREIDSKEVILGLIPFFHGYGCIVLLRSLMQQKLLVCMPRFEEKNFLSSIEKYKITTLYLVPPIVVFLSKHPLVAQYDLSSVKQIICGAAPLSKTTQLAAQNKLNMKSNIHQGYGMTELSICCVAFQNDTQKIGSVGTIAPGMELKVVDTEKGKALPPNHHGELCFRGPFVMKGYKGNEKETAAAFDSDGWFHTGDIGYYDNDGYIYIVSRLKELIKYKGFQVAPAELESILLDHPAVKEAGVIGIPDEEAGELPMAFVVKQSGVEITEDEIIKYVAGKVSPQKRLHGGVKFINEIPKNPSGKILRRELHAMLKKSKL